MKNYQPDHGPFENYAVKNVKLFVSRALVKFREAERRRPEHEPLPEYDLAAKMQPTTGAVPMSVELRDLPDELRDVVRLYQIDGYTMEDVGLLLGLSKATVRTRLIQAARELNPGFEVRPRAAGANRLASGGRGR